VLLHSGTTGRTVHSFAAVAVISDHTTLLDAITGCQASTFAMEIEHRLVRITVWVILLWMCVYQFWDHDSISTALVILSSSASSKQQTVLCYGDSHTKADVGAPWVPKLQDRLGEATCIALGRDGEVTEGVMRRVRATSKEASVIVVFAGTNDAILDLAVQAGNTAAEATLKRVSGLPRNYEPGPGAFKRAYAQLLRFACSRGHRTPARINRSVVAVSLPPLGDEFGPSAAAKISQYNDIIRAVAGRKGAVYAPFAEALSNQKTEIVEKAVVGTSLERASVSASVRLNEAITKMLINQAANGLGIPFDLMASFWNGGQQNFLHDGIHLTERASNVLVDTLAPIVEGLLIPVTDRIAEPAARD